MPTYRYECRSCGAIHEEFQSINDKPLRKCPACGGRLDRLIGGGSGILLKGSGFHNTDYRSSSYREAAKGESAAASASTSASGGEKGAGGDKSPGAASAGDKSSGDKSAGAAPGGAASGGEKPASGAKSDKPKPAAKKGKSGEG